MKKLLPILFISLFFIGCSKGKSSPKAVESASTSEISLSEMDEKAITVTKHSFCYPDSFFRSCFEFSEEECIVNAEENIRECYQDLANSKPNLMDNPAAFQGWMSQVGACAGANYQKANMDSFKKTPECQNPQLDENEMQEKVMLHLKDKGLI